MIKVVIFDLDGLLVDSQPLQYKACNEVYTKHGYPLTHENWCDWIHNSYNSKKWIEKYNLPLDFVELRVEKKIIYDKLIESDLELKPSAQELINKLCGKYELSVASGSSIESINLMLDKFKLIPKFQEIVSDQEVKNGKPYPDVFLKTAKLMKAAPEECVVIEDSLAGLNAAKAANMKCIVCPDSFCDIDRSKYKDADIIIDNLSEVTLEMISNL